MEEKVKELFKKIFNTHSMLYKITWKILGIELVLLIILCIVLLGSFIISKIWGTTDINNYFPTDYKFRAYMALICYFPAGVIAFCRYVEKISVK
jgi:hypothetical protein